MIFVRGQTAADQPGVGRQPRLGSGGTEPVAATQTRRPAFPTSHGREDSMSDLASGRRELADPFGEWAGTRGALMSYRYLASRPTAIDRTHAEGRIALRPDLRTPGGVLAAPLAIAMLDVAGINIDPVNILALTQVDMEVVDPAADVDEVYLRGHVTCETRSQIFTEVRLY